MNFDKVLITGGSGLLGRYVVDEMRKHAEVSVLDLREPAHDLPFHRVDIADRDAVFAAVAGHDAIIHLAALDQAVEAPEHRFFGTNVMGLWNLLEAAEASGVRRVVSCSSIAAVAICREYPPRYLPIDTDHPCSPTSAYGLSKQVGETVAQCFVRRSPMTVCALRPAWVMQPDIVYDVAKKTAALDGGDPPPAASHSSWRETDEEILPSRSFVSPEDAAHCFRAALETDTGPWDVFNLSAAESFSPLPTTELARRAFGAVPALRDAALYEREPRASIYGIERTRERLGWHPQDRFADLLDRALAQGADG